MKVISLVNGSLTSHTTAIFALHYAKQLSLDFCLVYIHNEETVEYVKNSIEDIEDLASSFGVSNDFETFKNLEELKQFVESKDIDTLFCSTKQHKTIYDRSFLTRILDMQIKVDIAVVKVVKIGRAHNIDKIIMPIRDAKLSVNKFTLFSTFSLTYDAKSEIYSVDKISKIDFSKKTVEVIKQRLQEIIFNLRHYLRLGKMIDFKFAIRHDYAFVEGEKIQAHIANHGYDLIIMGGHHQKSFFWKHPIDILFEKPLTNTIYFIPYKDAQ